MWIWYVLLALFLLAPLIMLAPVRGRVTYDGETLLIRIKTLGLPLVEYCYPEPEVESATVRTAMRKLKKQQQKTQSEIKELVELLKEDDVAGTTHFLSQTAQALANTANRFVHSVHISRFHLQMRIATGDAADTAQRYGQVCSIVYPAIAALEGVMRMRGRRVRIEPNFLLDESAVRADIRLWMPLWRLPSTWGTLVWKLLAID